MNMSEQAPDRPDTCLITPRLIAEQLVRLNRRPVGTSARTHAALHWIFWMACVVAGAREPSAQAWMRR